MPVISKLVFCSSECTYGKSSYFYSICSNPFHISIRISTLLASSRSPWPNSDCAKSRAALLVFIKVLLVNTEVKKGVSIL